MRSRTYLAQVVSLALHVAGMLVFLLLLSQSNATSDQLPQPKGNQKLIYVASMPGSSGGGGGSSMPAPPTPAQIPKPMPVSLVPVVSAAPADPPPPTINAPVMTSPDALLSATGINGAVAVPRGGGGNGTGIGPSDGPGLGPGKGPGFGDTGIGGEGGIDMPIRIMEVKPEYTPEAMRAKIQGPVVLQAIVDVSGRVTDVRVVKSLDRVFGLDEAAKRAAAATRFKPCKQDGKPVACIITFELQFTLR